MSVRIYLEGGGDSKDGRARCREGSRKLLEKYGFRGRMPRLVASGGRDSAYDDFTTAHARAAANYIAMLINSEDPVPNIDETWDHMRNRYRWEIPRCPGRIL